MLRGQKETAAVCNCADGQELFVTIMNSQDTGLGSGILYVSIQNNEWYEKYEIRLVQDQKSEKPYMRFCMEYIC